MGNKSTNKWKKESQKKKRKENTKTFIIAIIVFAFCLAITLGYFKFRDLFNDIMYESYENPATLANTIEASRVLTLKGNFKSIELHAAILADKKQIASIKEDGVFSPTVLVTTNNVTVFTIKENADLANEMGCRVYEFKDENDQTIGFASESVEDGSFAFLDAAKNDTGYDVTHTGSCLSDPTNTQVGDCTYFPSRENQYYEIDCIFTSNEIPAEYRIFMLYLNYLTGYSYNSSGVMP